MIPNGRNVIFLFLLSLIFIPANNCFAIKAYEWVDINKPIEIVGGHELRKGDLVVNVNLSSNIIEATESIRLYVDYRGWNPIYGDFILTINDSIFEYKVRRHIDIFTRHLATGLNVLKFRCQLYTGMLASDCDRSIKRLSFPDISDDSFKNVAETKVKEIKKPKRSKVSESPILLESGLKKSLSAEKNKDAIAVVIGNMKYSHKDIPSVKYAINDAAAIKKFLINTLGYKDGNIIFETNTSKAGLEKIFGTKDNHRGMLFNYIKPNKSDVFIYYSGHGSPDPTTNEAYLVPFDCDPVMMALTAYPLNALYSNLPKVEAKRVTVVIDACFSGGTNTGTWLVQNASPALIKVNNPVSSHNNITIFTSAENNQVSSWYPEKQHSMFTYFFLKAIIGDADFNQDNQITFQEIYNFVADRAEGVPYYSKRLHGGRIQTPTIYAANTNAVFVRY